MCFGRLASSCGKENIPKEAIDTFTQFAISCLSAEQDNKLELRETAFGYFGDIAVIEKQHIDSAVFETVLREILRTCNSESEMKEVKQMKGEKKFSLDSDSDQGLVGVDVDVYQLDEKSAAISALGVICMHAPNFAKLSMQ